MKNRRLLLLVALVTVAACDRKADKPPAPKTAEVAPAAAFSPSAS